MRHRPFGAFFLSFALGLTALFGGQMLLSDVLTPAPDARIGPIDIPAT